MEVAAATHTPSAAPDAPASSAAQVPAPVSAVPGGELARLDPRARATAVEGLQRACGNRAVQALARQTKTAEPDAGTGNTDPFKGTLVNAITISLARGRVGFSTPLGMILGDVKTDLAAGRYKLRLDAAQKRWSIVEPAVKPGARFEVDLEGADPWTLRYPDVIPLYVAVGSVDEPKTFGDMMGPEGLKDPLWLYEGWPQEARPKPIAGPDDFESAYYDLDYRSEKGGLSKWVRVTYRDGSVKDVYLDDIKADQPKLTAVKQEALRVMDDYNALFILGTFPTVFFLLTMATSIDPAAPNPTVRYSVRRVTLRKPSKAPVDPEKGVVTNDPVKPAAKTEPPPVAPTPSPQAARAQQLTEEIAGRGEPVIVNIGGAGARHEPQNAINLNNQAVARKDIPNLVEADGAQIGELFPAGKVDGIEGHNMAPGVVDWTRGAPGSFKVLKPGGKFSYAYRGANSDAKLLESELRKAGFTDVKNTLDVLVTATKP